MTAGLSWTTRLLLEQSRGAKRARYNPRPAGQVQDGSATAKVLKLMRAQPQRRWRRQQLLILTGCTESAMDWALIYLRSQGTIQGLCSMHGRQWTYWLAEASAAPSAAQEA